MRQAAGIVRDDAIHPGGVDVRELALEHAVRDLGVLEAERAAEPAADRRLGHLHDLDAGDLTEERAWVLVDAEDVRGLTRVVVSGAQPEPSPTKRALAKHRRNERSECGDALGEL